MDKQVIKILLELLEGLRIVFLSNEDVFPPLKLFFIHPNEKICYNRLDTICCQFCVLKISCASIHNGFVELDQVEVNIQGAEHDLQRIEQICANYTGTRK